MKIQQIQGSSALNQQEREIIHISASVTPLHAKLRVAGYARVSSDSDDQLNSFSAQVRYYTKLIEQNPQWEFCDVYADEGVSGVSMDKRADFNRLIADCRKGKIDRIITKSTSRFARNTMDTLGVIRELKELGVTVLFEKEGIDTASLTSENLLTLYALFAQEESHSISQNMKKGVRMKMRNGTYIPSNAAYGYRLKDKTLVPYDSEAEIVRRIFREYLSGNGIGMIAKGLSADKIKRKDGKTDWHGQVVLAILKNERYIGDMLFQKSYSDDEAPYNQYLNKGELPQYYVKGTHEPIVDRMTFELTNLLLKERGVGISTNRSTYLLSCKIKCGRCGHTYRRKEDNEVVYWVCRTHDKDATACGSSRIIESDIYRVFTHLYNKLKAHGTEILKPMVCQLERLREAKQRNHPAILSLNKQIADISEQIHVMNGLLSKGILDSALFISQTDELNRKLRDVKVAKARLIEESDDDSALEKTKELLEILENGPELMTEVDNTLFGEMVEKIIARDEQSVDFVLVNGLVLKERLVT